MKKNKILLTITSIVIFIMFFSMACLDSESIIPVVVFILCVSYLFIFNYINRDYEW